MTRKLFVFIGSITAIIVISTVVSLNAFQYSPEMTQIDVISSGCGGKTIINFAPDWVTSADLAVQPDGKLVAVGFIYSGSAARMLVVRYEANGELDTTFGNNGIVITDLGQQSNLNTVAIQDDNKIVAAGKLGLNGVLVRYNEDGSLDTTFNGTGVVSVDFDINAWLNDLAILPDGRIVVVGTLQADWSFPANIGLARYHSNGTLDDSFGIIVTDLGGDNSANGLVAKDTNIIVVGSHDGDFVILSYDHQGSLDPDFGDAGVVTIDFGGTNDRALDVALQPDGRIVVVGSGFGRYALARLHSSGLLDDSFGQNGLVTLDESTYISGVVIQPDEKIIVLGSSFYLSSNRFRLARLEANGELDTTFGTNGIVITQFVWTDRGSGLVLQPDGRIIAGGHSNHTFLTLGRYEPNGQLIPCEPLFLPIIVK
jgi:uncharacterized delta-60 repeat protein